MLIVATMTGTLTTRLKKQEKVKAEAETERMRGNLLRAVSTTCAPPLTAIYGACSAMMENYDTFSREKHLKMLAGVSADAQWLVRMVENLLSITRIDAGDVELKKQDTVLEELVDALLVKFRKHYPGQKVQVSLPEEFLLIPMDAHSHRAGADEPAGKCGVPRQGNEKPVAPGGAESASGDLPGGGRRGGHPRGPAARLFTTHLGGDTPSDSSRSSMGIGLSVCSTIVKAHGSRIYAQNRPEGGACFYFALELEDTSDVEQQV